MALVRGGQYILGTARAGSKLNPSHVREGARWQAGIEAVLGKTPAYGILGEAVETSASCEARSAPLPYPTRSDAT